METPFKGLTGKQRCHLRGLAHNLHSVVQVGRAGITKPVLAAIDDSLEHHELIKVKLSHEGAKKEDATAIATACSAALCGIVGSMAILYRRHPERPKIDPDSLHAPGFLAPASSLRR